MSLIRCAGHFLVLLILAACGAPPPPEPPPRPPRVGIADLQRLPQRLEHYLPAEPRRPLVTAAAQARLAADYEKHFFAPWQRQRGEVGVDKAFWGVADFGTKQGYGENLQPYGQEQWALWVAAARRERYPSLARPAITVRDVDCRVLPTRRPFFLDPAQPGEGFPFDYFQNSVLWAGTPLLVTHSSSDGAWYFVEAGYVFGWVPVEAVAWADKGLRKRYQSGRYAALLRDDVTLRDAKGRFLLQSRLGALFPVGGQGDASLRLLVPQRDADGSGVLRTAVVSTALVQRWPLVLHAAQLAALADGVLGQPYGWGGLYGNRDCSSTLRDLFTPFGLWLPRNSSSQANDVGTLLALEGKTVAEKKAAILTAGVPFYSLIWLKGHIGLYLGRDASSGEPLMLHNAWGIRTRPPEGGAEGRAVIGGLAITTLRPGEERDDIPAGGYYERVRGLTRLPGEPSP